MQKHYLIIAVLCLFLTQPVFTQNPPQYPRITGYAGIMHPLITINKNHITANFDDYYQVFLPFGINIWKSSRISFSLELVPGIRLENGSSKMNNLLIHPGVLVNLGKGYGFAGRLAFETSGRYGLTPIFSKVVKKNKNSALYVATPLPVRFGINLPSSFSAGLLLGVSF